MLALVRKQGGGPLSAEHILTVLYTSNMIGIAFVRSLHVQFYAWYSFSLPFLLWRAQLPTPLRLALLFAIEWAFNVYPFRPLSSAVLQLCHLTVVAALWQTPLAPTRRAKAKGG